MKIGDIPRRLFFCVEKVAVFETGTEGQAGTDKKRLGMLFFDVSCNQYRLVPVKSEPR
jgi:hypothetical protein